MRILFRLCLVCLGCTLLGACSTPAPPPAPENNLKPTTTIKDIMDSIVDPSADVLWAAVETDIGPKGIEQHEPRTDEEWATVRKSAVQLLEATNLLLIEGRTVAKPGEKSATPGIELEPEQIEALINGDRPTFVKNALGLRQEAQGAFNAIEARNAQALSDAGAGIDTACENCHKIYWYPKDKRPAPTAPTPATSSPGN